MDSKTFMELRENPSFRDAVKRSVLGKSAGLFINLIRLHTIRVLQRVACCRHGCTPCVREAWTIINCVVGKDGSVLLSVKSGQRFRLVPIGIAELLSIQSDDMKLVCADLNSTTVSREGSCNQLALQFGITLPNSSPITSVPCTQLEASLKHREDGQPDDAPKQ